MSIVERIIPVFYKNIHKQEKGGMWDHCNSHAETVELTVENLEDMAHTELIWGFFGGTQSREIRPTIVKFAQAVGIVGIENPGDDGVLRYPKLGIAHKTYSAVLQEIETKLGFEINLPEFIGNGDGLKTKYGVITDRHCYTLWLMKRIIELCPDRNSRIIEIGAGLGLLGYYLDKAGYNDYTIIDLAYSNICQTYFLNRNLPDRDIIISGEEENPFDVEHKDSLKILHSSDFKNIGENKFDIMINMDGLVEMKAEQAFAYFTSDCSPLLLSINHEVNEFRVCELDKNESYRKRLYRHPFWLRTGYVEELYKNNL